MQAYRQAAPRRRRRGSSGRKRPAAATWDNSDASLSGSDTDESDLSSVPSERGDKEKAVQEWDVPKDLDRPELGDSDEDSEYEAMRRCAYLDTSTDDQFRDAAVLLGRQKGRSPRNLHHAACHLKSRSRHLLGVVCSVKIVDLSISQSRCFQDVPTASPI